MESKPPPNITAETAALTLQNIHRAKLSVAEVSRRTLIPGVSLHRKVNGISAMTVNDLAAIALATGIPFSEFLPKHLTGNAA
ncbi:hypothetical protein [Arthrobacter sp. USHLN218]|uniref:hypothetical protein n=1 Tax=Arthrobacter sp. USHLN218 TaxID=3081232 RepID=UPI003016944B